MKQKSVLIGIVLLVLGALIGFGITSRHYGVGPLAGLSGLSSSADVCSAQRAWLGRISAIASASGRIGHMVDVQVARSALTACLGGAGVF